jgi:NAD-dependent deacetylase
MQVIGQATRRAMALAPELIADVAAAAVRLDDLLSRAGRIVGFTGAGLSTECGVPDFRSAGSPWMANKPIPYDAFVASEAARIEAWRRKFAMDDHYAGARPGRGHAAFARLVASGRMPAVVTQNIDGLHQASAIPDEAIVELHGNGTYAKCLSCEARHELAFVRPIFEATGRPPVCEACGGVLKSATVSFGQAMPQAQLRRALDLALDCDLFLAAGSSLVVYPAASLPALAARQGARLVIVNREATALDEIATLVIRADIGDVLDRVARSTQAA